RSAGAAQEGKSNASSGSPGGGRAGAGSGVAVGRPGWRRIRLTTGGSSIVARKRRRPPQAHARISISKMRRRSSTHARWRRGDRGGGPAEDTGVVLRARVAPAEPAGGHGVAAGRDVAPSGVRRRRSGPVRKSRRDQGGRNGRRGRDAHD